MALKEGKTIPKGWAVDKDGNDTTDPAAANIGALMPFGGPKGYAIGLIISILSSALSGSAIDINIPRFWEETDKLTNIGYFMGCIDISKFVDLDIFKERVDSIFRLLKNSRPASGFKEVMMPGEIEYNLTKANLENGIEMSDISMKEMKELAEKYEIPYPFN